MTEGGPPVTSIARRRTPCQATSVRGQSNQMLSEVLRAGRESTAGLSLLSTPDSILMCSRNRYFRYYAQNWSKLGPYKTLEALLSEPIFSPLK